MRLLPEPRAFSQGQKAGKTEEYHEDKGTQALHLVFSGSAKSGIELGKVFHYQIQVQQAEFFCTAAYSRCNLVRWEESRCTLISKMEVLWSGEFLLWNSYA